jgi:hypothetical protein
MEDLTLTQNQTENEKLAVLEERLNNTISRVKNFDDLLNRACDENKKLRIRIDGLTTVYVAKGRYALLEKIFIGTIVALAAGAVGFLTRTIGTP